jgi:hypothetical protein
MIFPPVALGTATARGLLGLGSAALLAVAGLTVAPAPARADDDAVLHQVTYTVTADHPYYANIYYRDTDPANFADYSHNPYVFSPRVEADVGPGAPPWVLQANLADPDQWAMVAASITGASTASPMFHCQLAVDGVVVAKNDGPKGALCSLRNW